MYKTEVKTNSIPRLLSYWDDLPPEAQEDFDYHEPGSWGREAPIFFRYRGAWYDSTQGTGSFNGWTCQHHTIWDGIVYKKTEMNEGQGVVVGYYHSVYAGEC